MLTLDLESTIFKVWHVIHPPFTLVGMCWLFYFILWFYYFKLNLSIWPISRVPLISVLPSVSHENQSAPIHAFLHSQNTPGFQSFPNSTKMPRLQHRLIDDSNNSEVVVSANQPSPSISSSSPPKSSHNADHGASGSENSTVRFICKCTMD